MARPRSSKATTASLGTNALDLSPQRHILRRVAATLVVTVPVDFVRELGWEEGQGLVVRLVGRTVVVEKE